MVAALVLTGCNANQAINPSSQPPSQVFAGHYVDYNPYDPISYAQNNTGTRRRSLKWPMEGLDGGCTTMRPSAQW